MIGNAHDVMGIDGFGKMMFILQKLQICIAMNLYILYFIRIVIIVVGWGLLKPKMGNDGYEICCEE